jgi:hypothetical protein
VEERRDDAVGMNAAHVAQLTDLLHGFRADADRCSRRRVRVVVDEKHVRIRARNRALPLDGGEIALEAREQCVEILRCRFRVTSEQPSRNSIMMSPGSATDARMYRR